MINLLDAITHLRRIIDQIVYSQEDAVSLAEIEATSVSRFSNEQLAFFLYYATLYVTSRVESIHFKYWSLDTTPGTIPSVPVYRLQEESVMVDDVPATRMSYRALRKLLASCRIPTDEYPVYAYEDCDLTVYGDTENPAGATVRYTRVPVDVSISSSWDELGGGGPNVVTIDDPLFTANAVGSFLTINGNTFQITAYLSNTQVEVIPNVPAVGGGDIVAWTEPAINFIPKRLQEPIVNQAASTVFASIGRVDLAEHFEGLADQGLEGYRLTFFESEPEYITPT